MLLMLTSPVSALDITFEWEPPETGDVDKYRLYQSAQSGVYTFGNGNWVAEVGGTFLTATIDIADGQWYWVCTAVDAAGNESEPSNEVSMLVDTIPPDPPKNLSVMIKVTYDKETGQYDFKVVRLFQDGKKTGVLK